jgi:hypothetical protein
MRTWLLAGLWICGLASAWACSSSPEVTDGGSDASAPDVSFFDGGCGKCADSAIDAPPESGLCNDLMQLAMLVQEKFVPQNPPVAQGGAIVNGTYTVTAASVYTGEGGMLGNTGRTITLTATVSNGMVNFVYAGVNDQIHQNGTFATDGSAISAMLTCKDPGSLDFTSMWSSFDVNADAGTFMLLGKPSVMVQSLTLTKQ